MWVGALVPRAPRSTAFVSTGVNAMNEVSQIQARIAELEAIRARATASDVGWLVSMLDEEIYTLTAELYDQGVAH
jgi:hypothetical protein